MAKITITIEDQPQGQVKFLVEPTAETLLKKIASHGPQSLTGAETYALACVNRVRQIAKSLDSSTTILVPRVRGRSL